MAWHRKRWKAITWTNTVPIHLHIYATLGGDESISIAEERVRDVNTLCNNVIGSRVRLSDSHHALQLWMASAPDGGCSKATNFKEMSWGYFHLWDAQHMIIAVCASWSAHNKNMRKYNTIYIHIYVRIRISMSFFHCLYLNFLPCFILPIYSTTTYSVASEAQLHKRDPFKTIDTCIQVRWFKMCFIGCNVYIVEL